MYRDSMGDASLYVHATRDVSALIDIDTPQLELLPSLQISLVLNAQEMFGHRH